MLDRIARKTLLFADPAPDGSPLRFFVKGHFLAAADALAAKYPDARFLTMIREPVDPSGCPSAQAPPCTLTRA